MKPKATSKSARRRRQYGPLIALERVGHGESNKSRQVLQTAYGDMPFQQAGGLKRQFTDPISAAFGIRPIFGEGAKGQRREARYDKMMAGVAGDQGPLGSYIQQAQQFLPSMFGSAQEAGSRIASLAPQLFDQLRGQIQGGLDQIPGLSQAAAGNTQAAQGALGDAQSALRMAQQSSQEQFNPIASQALYQNALRGSLEGMAPQAAARGLGDAGSQMAREETLGRDLAAQFAQNQFANQQASLMGQQQALGGVQQGLGGVQQGIGTQAGLTQLGPQLMQQLQDSLPGLQQALQAGYQMPMDALQAVFQQIAAAQNPQLALLQTTTPQALTYSSGKGWGAIAGG